MQDIIWTESNRCHVGGVDFFATVRANEYHSTTSSNQEFLIVKTREMIEAELKITASLNVRNIVDIGIWQGGSVALFDCIFQPEKLVAIEYATRDLPTLDEYIVQHARGDNVRLFNGVDQGNAGRLNEILDTEFGTERIDLVVDDASHQYVQTTSSFNVLFPRLSDGGVFVIEDWGWSTKDYHYNSDYFAHKPGLANLVMQCVIGCTCRPDIIREVVVNKDSVFIIRGETELHHGDFDISNIARNKGEQIPLVL
ncbi:MULTISPECIES: class I SAM-dependent methyltransferase [unclassified Ruegeria]|uniref:class I SAM-dependent methyltransferase n=1 Tax=unclassified Ruegeria TaxID=2625375 RepID=UPI0014919514|nr:MULTISPECIES: class I SAM-dependent methyltransferase [unclassified Ruegeria]NOD88749.1 hypothetical protein [Ruegeria sp. HKCCD4318]NOE16144.1 hypothetical protein [Ruegeria sp. HKCCD4318-2]NOG09813.1 class I SAM-dependent methyltransferase [Ruegeria sp. HKCCD4315]